MPACRRTLRIRRRVLPTTWGTAVSTPPAAASSSRSRSRRRNSSITTTCTCEYGYGGFRFAPSLLAPWLVEITQSVCRACGLKELPNACNANLYMDGTQAVGWHADDEALFDALNRDVLIISLSLGVSRHFELRAKDDPTLLTELLLENGDLCMMEGLVQKHYCHRVMPEPHITGPRINLTWRWIVKHWPTCPKSLKPEAPVPVLAQGLD
eukprot:NODE_10390_length_1355_cov_10.056189.p2 GENE.NODE_10390_length_1355_cov_10.056189~~NODE_10390_length_1355_cov_10.056189.p2  ORF type:complete len:210 (-),score=37.53 NODE_10390_length_1355_cov_10.056189:193-822(-)